MDLTTSVIALGSALAGGGIGYAIGREGWMERYFRNAYHRASVERDELSRQLALAGKPDKEAISARMREIGLKGNQSPKRKKAAKPEGDGWIKWNGGECPLPEHAAFDVKLRDGSVKHCNEWPNWWRWAHYGVSGDIIAYRVLSKGAMS